jgi:glycosyltransferase involved in cell wall biosynthesis
MKISVLVCTFNRCHSLANALDSILAQVLPGPVTWELIVVDNNSTDHTREVVGKYCLKYPDRIRYVFEPRQGLSRARNTGVREARGEIIAFIDDDVIAAPSWLQNLTGSMRNPKWAGAGGRIVPPPDFSAPDWLTVGGKRDLAGVLLPIFDLGHEACLMERAPYGANMSFRKSMFERYGSFRVDLGRCGDSLLTGEDIEFGNRLLTAGECLRYEPSAVVTHPVPEDRLNKSHFRKWWFDYGRTRIIQSADRPSVLRAILSLARLVSNFLLVRILQWAFTIDARRRFYNECQIWMTFGEIAQTFKEAIGLSSKTRQGIPLQSIGQR